MSTETFEHTFNVETPAQLKVSNVRGNVDIRPGEEGVIAVTVVKHGRNGRTQIIIEQQDDGKVIAEAKYENSITNWFGFNKPDRVDFTIRVPKACSVKVNCVSSSAFIEGVEGDIDLDGVSGNLQLKDLSGNFDLSSVSGKINAENLNGSLKFSNVSGRVRISESNLPSISGSTVSGHVKLQTPLADGPYNFNSVSGHVILAVPEDTACTVIKKSVSGRTRVSLPSERRGNGRNGIVEVQGGGVEVNLSSVSGHMIIRTDLDQETTVPDVEAQTPEPAAPAKSQMEILQEIENGDISVEEALEQLNP